MTAGFAMFSMFFGSGNLVFPLAVGFESEGHYFLASLGIFATCVLFPFLGMMAIALCKGELSSFLGCFGKKGTFLFSLMALSLMGPFGVVARCLTVAHGAVMLIFPEASLVWTSAFLCAVVFALSLNKSTIVDLVGMVLTPALLLAIAGIAFFAFMGGVPDEIAPNGGWSALTNGYFQGYQTMDLVASLYFSGFLIKYLRGKFPDGLGAGKEMKMFFAAASIAAGLLYAVYFILVFLGSRYVALLANVPPQEMLGTIAYAALGPYAAACVCITVVLACLTTAVALASLFAEFLQVDVCRSKIGNPTALLATMVMSFLVSTLDFNGIASLLKPVLSTIYPPLIVLTLAAIASHFSKRTLTHWPFSVALVLKLFTI